MTPVPRTPDRPAAASTATAPVRPGSTGSRTGPRADAVRNREAVLDAALRLFRTDPTATVAQVAAAAGVGRVTLYGHYPTREALVGAALSEAVARAQRAMGSVQVPDGACAPAAVQALLGAAWPALADGHGAVAAACRELPADEVADRHEPVVRPLRDLLASGAAVGEVRSDLGVDWLVAAVSALVHAAAEEVAAGAMTHDAATASLTATVVAVIARPT